MNRDIVLRKRRYYSRRYRPYTKQERAERKEIEDLATNLVNTDISISLDEFWQANVLNHLKC